MAAGEEEEEEESRRGRRREGEIESAGADCMGKGAAERRRPGTTLFELSRRPRFHEQSTRAGGFTAARQTGQSWWFGVNPAGCGRQDGCAGSEEGFGDGAIGSTMDA